MHEDDRYLVDPEFDDTEDIVEWLNTYNEEEDE